VWGRGSKREKEWSEVIVWVLKIMVDFIPDTKTEGEGVRGSFVGRPYLGMSEKGS